MKESYHDTRLTLLNNIEEKYRLANVVRHAIKSIGVPEGLSEPDIYMQTVCTPVSICIWLHSWPMEVGCGYVAELEELLFTTAKVAVNGSSQVVEHHFYSGSPFAFAVYVSPSNCTWEGDPGKWEYVESKKKPKCF